MNRILNWHFGGPDQPSFYIERDYTPSHLRIYSPVAPSGGDLEIDIRDDGVSIFADRTVPVTSYVKTDAEIQYSSQSAGFTVGETVTGGTSSATGVVVSDTLGDLRLTNTAGDFVVDETITGGTSSSTANVDGYSAGGITETTTQDEAKNVAILAEGDTLNEMEDDFIDDPVIETGSIVTCHLINANGANNFTVQLELESLDEEDEEAE